MSTISSQEVISIVKGEIEDYDAHAGRIRETGSVIWVGDGIAIVYGIDHAMYGAVWFRTFVKMRLAVSFLEKIQELWKVQR